MIRIRPVGRTATTCGRRALALALLASASLVAQDAPRQTFRGGANVVLVDVYPKRDGKIVEGLTKADFQVLEDGRPQQIDTLEFVRVEANVPDTERRDPQGLRGMYTEAANPMNRVFVAFLDTPHVAVDGGVVTRGPVSRALDSIIGRDDLFGVMTPDIRATDLTLGRRRESVDEELSRHWTWGQSDRMGTDLNDSIEMDLRMCFHDKFLADGRTTPWLITEGPVRRHLDEILIERRREDRTLSSLQNLIDHLSAVRETRSVVFLLSNGWMLVPERSELIEEPFKRPEDVRFIGVRTLSGIPRAGDELTREAPPRVGERRVSEASDSRMIIGCFLELQRLAQLDHPRRFRDLVVRAARSNVSIFPVAIGGLKATDAGAAERVIATGSTESGTFLGRDLARMTGRVQALRTIAENTGGRAIVNTNDIGGAMVGLADELSSYYLLSYSPTNARRDGRYRRIEVKSSPSGLDIRARPGYVANEVLAASVATVSAPARDARAIAVESALGALGRARASSELTTRAVVEGLTIATVVELGAGFRTNGWANGAKVDIEITAAGGSRLETASGNIPPGQRGIVIRTPVGISQGPWRVLARVTGARPIQDLLTVVSVPAAILGEPLVYRASPAPKAPTQAVADLLFSRAERLRVVWPVVDAPTTVTARLLDREGRALGESLPTERGTESDRAIVSVDLVLGALSDGDYLVEVQATRGAAVERKLQAFRVVR
jgi:VWFA-related protein